MLLCDNCNNPLEKGYICPTCRRLLCNDCFASFNCDCGNTSLELILKLERIKNVEVQWVITSGGKKFGLSGFNSFPILAFKLLELISIPSRQYGIIFADSRASSKKLLRIIGNEQAKNKNEYLFLPKGPGSRSSRYSVLIDPIGEENLVFLEAPKIKESSLRFLIIYFNNFFEINSTYPIFDKEKLNLVMAGLTSVFEKYNLKYGIKFVSYDEVFFDFSKNFLIKFRTSFIDYLTLRKLANDKDFYWEIPQFISGKIETLFTLAPKNDITLLLDAINVWGLQTEGFTLVTGLSSNKHLHTLAKKQVHTRKF